MVDARVVGPGIQILNNWHISKPVLVLRAYMSDSLLTNNSLQDLSRTYEKHLPAADIQMVVERAVLSSGDLFFVRLIIQPQRKRVRLEHMELTITENRRYHVAEVRANRKDSELFPLHFLQSVKLAEDDSTTDTSHDSTSDLRGVFQKNGKGLDLTDTMAYRITFATPTCMRNIHHTTYYKDIMFKHHLSINMTISFVDDSPVLNDRPTLSSNSSSTSENSVTAIEEEATRAMFALAPPPAAFSMSSTNTNTHIRSPSPSVWPKIRKVAVVATEKPKVMRKRETIRLETPVTIFDCRLKEDYGRLPSYSELNVTAHPAHGDDKNKMLPDLVDRDFMLQCMPDSDEQIPSSEPQPQLCPCYFKFRRQMEMASQAQLLMANHTASLERIPSMPPPDYVENQIYPHLLTNNEIDIPQ